MYPFGGTCGPSLEIAHTSGVEGGVSTGVADAVAGLAVTGGVGLDVGTTVSVGATEPVGAGGVVGDGGAAPAPQPAASIATRTATPAKRGLTVHLQCW